MDTLGRFPCKWSRCLTANFGPQHSRDRHRAIFWLGAIDQSANYRTQGETKQGEPLFQKKNWVSSRPSTTRRIGDVGVELRRLIVSLRFIVDAPGTGTVILY